ncbi:hypothetical protein NDU88_000783 [Pleurodeles waltl]|uniref:Uncharacterized protein n=1 Tax=Pleurodeles waltl TaxID=8319 RepID=A0AAV7LXU8_PLEWA|nr:hypothetical protein NDU88_000783 [Pleurodeles waltl]
MHQRRSRRERLGPLGPCTRGGPAGADWGPEARAPEEAPQGQTGPPRPVHQRRPRRGRLGPRGPCTRGGPVGADWGPEAHAPEEALQGQTVALEAHAPEEVTGDKFSAGLEGVPSGADCKRHCRNVL